MKSLMFGFLVLSLNLFLGSNAQADASSRAECRGDIGKIRISGISTDKVVLEFAEGDSYEMYLSKDGDCQKRRAFDCYQDGQLMLNLPKDISASKSSNFAAWLNLDSDDDDSNERLGSQYSCEF